VTAYTDDNSLAPLQSPTECTLEALNREYMQMTTNQIPHTTNAMHY